LKAAIGSAGTSRAARLAVGVADIVPRIVAFRLLEPALRTGPPYVVDCLSDSPERLVVKLARHELDLVISSEPLDLARRPRADVLAGRPRGLDRMIRLTRSGARRARVPRTTS
jgi:LysR family transcriptional activator of nhaA